MEPEVKTEFSVEAKDVAGRWCLWGVWSQKGKPLNPCSTIDEAIKVRGNLEDSMKRDKTGWRGSRIVETVTTRRIVEGPIALRSE